MMKKIIYILIFNIQFFYFQNAQSQPGVIDSTFGVDGIVQAPIVSSHVATCRKVIPLTNGKILAVGNAFTVICITFELVLGQVTDVDLLL